MTKIYPAHAGINPVSNQDYCQGGDLPRTRGDKPLGFTIVADGVESTPHTRG